MSLCSRDWTQWDQSFYRIKPIAIEYFDGKTPELQSDGTIRQIYSPNHSPPTNLKKAREYYAYTLAGELEMAMRHYIGKPVGQSFIISLKAQLNNIIKELEKKGFALTHSGTFWVIDQALQNQDGFLFGEVKVDINLIAHHLAQVWMPF